MSLLRCIALLLPVSACLLRIPVSSIQAGDEWLPIDPAELKMTSEPKAPGAPAIYLYRQVDRKDLGRGNTEYNYLRIKILTEEGRNYANIQIPYYKERVSISGVRARTVRADGTVINFGGKVYDKMIEKSKGVKIKAKTFTVPDVQVGSIVEYHFNYDYEDEYVFNSYWALSDELFTKSAKFTLKPYPRFDVRWTWPAGLPPGTAPPKMQQDGYIRMTSQDIAAFQVEEYMPPENELKYRVVFIYSQENPEQDQAKYWRKFGKTQNDRLESFLGKRKELETAVSQMVLPNDTPEVKLQKIYARVQQLRNTTYEARKTEQEEKRDKQKKIENAVDILKYGYGDGADLTWLFLGLARTAGFEGYGALVSGRGEYFFNENRMNSRELDANVALIKLNGNELYFDPGSAFIPFGLLPWQETSVRGLRLDREGGTWIHTPLPESSASQIERKAELKLIDDGSLEGKVTLTYTGLEAWSRRLYERNQDDEARKKYLEEQLKDYIPAAVEVELKSQPDWKSSDPPLVAEFSVKIPGWVSAAGRRAVMPIGFFSATEKHMFEHANRVHPVYFAYPFQKTDDVTVQLPAGWRVSSLPKNQDKDAKAAEYVLKLEEKGNVVHLTRTLRSDLFMIPKDTYPSLRNFFQIVRSGDEQQVVLQPNAVAAGS